MKIDEAQVSKIVKAVMSAVKENGESHQKGVFESMTDALAAVDKAYKQYKKYTVAQREQMIANIRKLILQEAEVMAKLGVKRGMVVFGQDSFRQDNQASACCKQNSRHGGSRSESLYR